MNCTKTDDILVYNFSSENQNLIYEILHKRNQTDASLIIQMKNMVDKNSPINFQCWIGWCNRIPTKDNLNLNGYDHITDVLLNSNKINTNTNELVVGDISF